MALNRGRWSRSTGPSSSCHINENSSQEEGKKSQQPRLYASEANFPGSIAESIKRRPLPLLLQHILPLLNEVWTQLCLACRDPLLERSPLAADATAGRFLPPGG